MAASGCMSGPSKTEVQVGTDHRDSYFSQCGGGPLGDFKQGKEMT